MREVDAEGLEPFRTDGRLSDRSPCFFFGRADLALGLLETVFLRGRLVPARLRPLEPLVLEGASSSESLGGMG